MDISALLTQYGDKYLQALLTIWKLTVFFFAIAFLIRHSDHSYPRLPNSSASAVW